MDFQPMSTDFRGARLFEKAEGDRSLMGEGYALYGHRQPEASCSLEARKLHSSHYRWVDRCSGLEAGVAGFDL